MKRPKWNWKEIMFWGGAVCAFFVIKMAKPLGMSPLLLLGGYVAIVCALMGITSLLEIWKRSKR